MPIVMIEDGICGKAECVKVFFSISLSSRETQKMHSSESLDDNLEECSEGLVEEYSSSDQDLDDYTKAEGDGNDKADMRQDIPPMSPSKRSRQRSSGFNRRPLPHLFKYKLLICFSVNL